MSNFCISAAGINCKNTYTLNFTCTQISLKIEIISNESAECEKAVFHLQLD